jgi:hypothetical protein
MPKKRIQSIHGGYIGTNLHGSRVRSFKQQVSYFHESEPPANLVVENIVENKAMRSGANKHRNVRESSPSQPRRKTMRVVDGIYGCQRRLQKNRVIFMRM